jgi:hypothetical protein
LEHDDEQLPVFAFIYLLNCVTCTYCAVDTQECALL